LETGKIAQEVQEL